MTVETSDAVYTIMRSLRITAGGVVYDALFDAGGFTPALGGTVGEPSGTATVTQDDRVFTVEKNQSTYIPIGVKHRLENKGSEPLHIVEVQVGSYLGEDDIQRFEDNYGR